MLRNEKFRPTRHRIELYLAAPLSSTFGDGAGLQIL